MTVRQSQLVLTIQTRDLNVRPWKNGQIFSRFFPGITVNLHDSKVIQMKGPSLCFFTRFLLVSVFNRYISLLIDISPFDFLAVLSNKQLWYDTRLLPVHVSAGSRVTGITERYMWPQVRIPGEKGGMEIICFRPCLKEASRIE